VDRRCGLTLMDLFFPEDLAGFEIVSVDHPAVNVGGRFYPLANDVQAIFEGFAFALVDDRGDENLVTPDNRRAPAAAGDVDLPADVLGRAPRVRKIGPLSDPERLRTAELRPVGVAAKTCNHQERRQE